jgi:hypothetical protein
MLPAANLDYELEALGRDGVTGSGTNLFLRLAAEFPRRNQHIRGARRSLKIAAGPSTTTHYARLRSG